MLTLSRTPGSSVYVGREARIYVEGFTVLNNVVLIVESDGRVAISTLATDLDTHLSRQDRAEKKQPIKTMDRWIVCPEQGLRIGRSGYMIVSKRPRAGQVKLGFDCPKTVAVTRDDFSLSFHMAIQLEREARTPGASHAARTDG